MTSPPNPTGPPARLTQRRSRERRQRLLDAAFELYLQSGRRGVTHRTVTARAEVPVAALGYYFTNVDELLREALNGRLTAWCERLEAAAADEDATVSSAIDTLRETLTDEGAMSRSHAMRIYLLACDDPDLNPSARRLVTAIHDLLGVGFDRVGEADPRRSAFILSFAVMGHVLHEMAMQDDAEEGGAALYHMLSVLFTDAQVDDTARQAIDRLCIADPSST